ncbi:MAG: DUF349 domain-containing protein [Bacteroidales bacterium]|nr:DUF349 domain-containing protein [Bacteroidales bacterium]
MEETNQMQYVSLPQAEDEQQNPVAEATQENANEPNEVNEAPTAEENTGVNTSAQVSPIGEEEAKIEAPEEAPRIEMPVDKTQREAIFVEPEENYDGLNREELTEKLKTLLQEDVMHIKSRVSKVKDLFGDLNRAVLQADYEAFLADGGEKNAYLQRNDAVADAFYSVYDKYKALRQERIDAQEAEKKENLKKKQDIIDQLKAITESQEGYTLKAMYDKFNALQENWKAIGDVPRDATNDLWQKYHLWVEQFFAKVKLERESKMEDMKRNLEQKIQLCEKAEELIVDENEGHAFHVLQELREQWKAIGAVPPEQNDEIWGRFQNAADQISTRHREAIAQRREMLEKNLLAKQALVNQVKTLTEAEDPKTAKDWNLLTNQLDEMMKTWKAIGPVPREQNDVIWHAFKDPIDAAYQKKHLFFDEMKQQQDESYNKKIDLCQRAEAIAQRDDWREATKDLLQLQAEWKEAGNLNRHVNEKIWQRFRAACDTFFNRKSEHFKDLHGDEQENLQMKKSLLDELKAMTFGDDKEENLNKLKDIQRRWMEVGFVPRGEKDKLKQEFRDIINGYFEQLKISAREAEVNAFRQRVQGNADNPRFAGHAHDELQAKIDRLRNDINVLENNMGFFSNSKQADLLKTEFERKLQHAREQLALLETKMKILRTEQKEKNEQKSKEAKHTEA